MPTVASENVHVDRDGRVVIVTIDHPPANAISRSVVSGLTAALHEAAADPGCAALVLTGAGPRFFAAGADIGEFASAGGEEIAGGADLTLALESSRLPVVAAVNGVALGGGCELAMAADIRIASRSARFGQPEIRLGIIPGWGGTQRLPRLVGRSAALELLLTGDTIDADRALHLGLVSRVVDPENLMSAALEVARNLADQAPLAIAATKRAVAAGLDRPLPEALAAEQEEFVALFASEDASEGISAFLEKRAPRWRGR